MEIRYFTSGISWNADYVAEAATDEQRMALAAYVRLNNNSGEDYENAQVRLVVGVIRLVEEIAQLARAGRPGRMPMTELLKDRDELLGARVYEQLRLMDRSAGEIKGPKPKEIVKEGVS